MAKKSNKSKSKSRKSSKSKSKSKSKMMGENMNISNKMTSSNMVMGISVLLGIAIMVLAYKSSTENQTGTKIEKVATAEIEENKQQINPMKDGGSSANAISNPNKNDPGPKTVKSQGKGAYVKPVDYKHPNDKSQEIADNLQKEASIPVPHDKAGDLKQDIANKISQQADPGEIKVNGKPVDPIQVDAARFDNYETVGRNQYEHKLYESKQTIDITMEKPRSFFGPPSTQSMMYIPSTSVNRDQLMVDPPINDLKDMRIKIAPAFVPKQKILAQ